MTERTSPGSRSSSATVAMLDLLALAGVTGHLDAAATRDPADIVSLTGPTTALPSSFAVTTGSLATVGAFTYAVAELAALRRGDGGTTPNQSSPPPVHVDSVEACRAFRSERYLTLEQPIDLWDDLSGHYRTADGHIQFHTNFPHHRRRLLAAIGCKSDADRQRVEAVVAERGRFELEQEVSAGGGIAAALRSVDEWNEHPHAAHVADRAPLLTDPGPAPTEPQAGTRPTGRQAGARPTERQAGARPTERNAGPLRPAPPDRPLAGVRVLDMTRVIAGPVASKALAAYGADVLRVGADHLPVVEPLLPDTTLGKRFANCDLTTADGRTALLRLAAEADVVVTGFRPGALATKGVAEADLLNANPGLIIASLSAFGADGPWGGRRGFDSITQTATGIVAEETEAFSAEKPRPLPCQFLDHGTGYLLALGVVAALADRHRGLGARSIEASLLTTRNWLVGLGRTRDDSEAQNGSEAAKTGPDLVARDTAFGQIRHVAQPGRIDGVPARWERGPARPGSDQPEWLP